MKKFMIKLTALACAFCGVIGLVACNDDGSDEAGTGGDNGINSSVAVQTVELNKTELTLEIGGEETLTATVSPDNATDKTVKWSVSPAGIVTVDNGKVTAVVAGEAVITATADNQSAHCNVKVNASDPNSVSGERWTEVMQGVTQFTVDVSAGKRHESTVKIDGDKRWEEVNSIRQIVVKDGDNYYEYCYNSTWIKENAEVEDYEAFDFYARLVSCFKNDYSSFAFSNGVYTASSLDKTDALGTMINDVEIVFSDGVLVSIKFRKIGATDYQYEVNDIGNTTVSLPTDYTEIN